MHLRRWARARSSHYPAHPRSSSGPPWKVEPQTCQLGASHRSLPYQHVARTRVRPAPLQAQVKERSGTNATRAHSDVPSGSGSEDMRFAKTLHESSLRGSEGRARVARECEHDRMGADDGGRPCAASGASQAPPLAAAPAVTLGLRPRGMRNRRAGLLPPPNLDFPTFPHSSDRGSEEVRR